MTLADEPARFDGEDEPPTAEEAVRWATARLSETGVPSPRVDAVRLLAHATARQETGAGDAGEAERLVLLRAPLTLAQWSRFERDVDERRRRVPLQHITGRAPFRYLDLEVGPGVFVPRPETEYVAGAAIDHLAMRGEATRTPLVVDLCTGSGAIALAVATEVAGATVVGVELSHEALAWAERNRDRLAPQVALRAGDATDAAVTGDLDGTVDVVVSNPPYVPPEAVPTEPEVAEHDPDLALFGLGEDGLSVPRAVAARAADLLRPGGLFVMEHADVQGEALARHLRSRGVWRDVIDRRDALGRPRYVTAFRA